ncbi:MAG: hypothetical protein KC431_28725, partial [Myxococcales bacterium]|nr:hypothetical protein [Myxococcales bacterium]
MIPQRARSWLSMLTLLTFVVAGACSFARVEVRSGFPEVDPQLAQRRTALGAPDRGDESLIWREALARAREGAQVALELGNHEEAGRFADVQLELARGELTARVLEGASEQVIAAAREELDTSAHLAVQIGDAILDGRLTLEAAQFMARPRREHRAIARALRLTDSADLRYGYARLWEALRGDGDSRAALQRLRWRGHYDNDMPVGTPQLTVAELGRRGSAVTDLLWNEAHEASKAGERERFSAAIDGLLKVDGLDGDALAAKVVLAAAERGEFDGDPTRDRHLLADLSPYSADPLGVQARAAMRREAAPGCLALALFHARRLLNEGGFGDARQILVAL